MSIEDNKQLVLRWREELWHKRNVTALDELCAPDYVGHIAGTPGPVRGREAFKQLITAYLAALDIRVTTEFLIADGDMVAVRDTNRVKSTGELRGMPPTGKEATLTSTDIYRIAGGQVVEQWFEADVTGLLQELGVWPASGQAGS